MNLLTPTPLHLFYSNFSHHALYYLAKNSMATPNQCRHASLISCSDRARPVQW